MTNTHGSDALWAGSSADLPRFPDSPCLHERFEAQAARTPDATAVVFEGQRLTYGALDRRANQVAHRLRALGVGPDVLVALCAERSLELVVGLLGIVKAGGAYVPLDPAYPKDRLDFMLQDSCAQIMVSHRGVRTEQRPSCTQVVLVEEVGGEPDTRVPSQVQPHHLAYVIYTSGSTGRPKGVLVTHGNVVRLFAATAAWYQFAADDVWPLFHSYAFDVSVWELWGALLHGGTLVVVPYWASRAPDAFYELLSTERVTVLNQTPSAFRQLVRAVLAATTTLPLALRYVICAGEALELQGLRPWFARMGDEQPRIINMYGITETTVHVTYRRIASADVEAGLGSVVGVPMPDLAIHLLDPEGKLVADGEVGEIYVEGAGLARGYLNRPDLTEQRFLSRTLPGRPPVRLYRAGDLAKRLASGELEYLGRIDHQVKIRGFRIELGEIESVIADHPAVREVIVLAREDVPGDKRLVAYVAPGGPSRLLEELRERLIARLPEYMVPSAFVTLQTLPLTENGKVNRKALPAPDHAQPVVCTEYVEPEGELEQRLAALWKRLLRVQRVGANDSFFELGGSSLLAVEGLLEVRRELGRSVPVVMLFQHPTVRGLAAALTGSSTESAAAGVLARAELQRSRQRDKIAIVGMAGRFPGAANLEDLWKNLCDGVESVRFFSDAELDRAVDGSDPRYVKARGVLEDAGNFDAAFFGETPANAELMDPQQRVLLQVAQAALDDAGVVPERHGGAIGVFAGTGHNTYLLHNVVHRPERIEALGELQMLIANDKDFVATRIAHRLNLTGPALSVHTACSTSLVAVCQAVRSLLDYECDVALAGAASVTAPQHAGHLYTEGGMLSLDGHTRPFDAEASGTVFSDGAGMVVLKRLRDAEKDGDRIYALIVGSAVNNDGGAKASYTAPSVAGQAAVISMAQAVAEVDPATITYVEAHGTATPLGDPVEVEALTQAFRTRTSARNFCALGSIKSNLGHLTAASGVAGLIKTAMAVHRGQLPPSLFYDKPNPNIDFAQTPFFVQTKLGDWAPAPGAPRRAGVSSFGVGGTNAHVIVEQAPSPRVVGPARSTYAVVLSAKDAEALGRAAGALQTFVEAHPDAQLADIAFTLATRRAHYAERRYVVASTRDELLAALRAPPEASTVRRVDRREARVAFVFPGQGTQYVGMGSALYAGEPVFRRAIDTLDEILRPALGRSLRAQLSPAAGDATAAEASLRQTDLTQPALFAVEYALSLLWQSWGIEPRALVGHSVGEFVAAALAGVFSLEDAAQLVAERGRLMQALPQGAMLSVRAPAAVIEARLRGGLALAASNGPLLCVVSGPTEEITRLAAELQGEDTACKLLHTSHAFHSPMMEPVVAPFAERVRKATLAAPRIPIFSTVTAAPLRDEEATDPMYWARHLRVPVRFTEALQALWADPSLVLLEVGPRGTGATLARQVAHDRSRQVAIQSLEDRPEVEVVSLARALGQLFLSGAAIDWEAYHALAARRPLSLPSYPFAQRRHWLQPGAGPGGMHPAKVAAERGLASAAAGLVVGDTIGQLVTAQLELMRAQLDALADSEGDT